MIVHLLPPSHLIHTFPPSRAGSYSDAGAESCVLCPPATYSPAFGAAGVASCIPCPPFSNSSAGSISQGNCSCVGGQWLRDDQCVSCSDCDWRQASVRYQNRADCLPCPTGNQDKYAGQGRIPKESCAGADSNYIYQYAWHDNSQRLEWKSPGDWHELFPGVPQPAMQDRGNLSMMGIVFVEDTIDSLACTAYCETGWHWLNASAWYQACLRTGTSVHRCEASARPKVRVLIRAAADFVRRGQSIRAGSELGQRFDQYSFGGCWPCRALVCPPGSEPVWPPNACPGSLETGMSCILSLLAIQRCSHQ